MITNVTMFLTNASKVYIRFYFWTPSASSLHIRFSIAWNLESKLEEEVWSIDGFILRQHLQQGETVDWAGQCVSDLWEYVCMFTIPNYATRIVPESRACEEMCRRFLLFIQNCIQNSLRQQNKIDWPKLAEQFSYVSVVPLVLLAEVPRSYLC